MKHGEVVDKMNWTHPPLMISGVTGLILLGATVSTGGASLLWVLWVSWAVLGVLAIRQAKDA